MRSSESTTNLVASLSPKEIVSRPTIRAEDVRPLPRPWWQRDELHLLDLHIILLGASLPDIARELISGDLSKHVTDCPAHSRCAGRVAEVRRCAAAPKILGMEVRLRDDEVAVSRAGFEESLGGCLDIGAGLDLVAFGRFVEAKTQTIVSKGEVQ